MKRIIFYRNYFALAMSFIAINLLLLFSNAAFAQSHQLINYVNKPELTQKQRQYADAWIKMDWVKSYHYIEIDPKLFNGNFLNLNLPQNINFNVDKQELIEHSGNLFSWIGIFQNPRGNADFVVHNDMITARISSFSFTYLIYPLGEGMQLLIECNGANMPQDESEDGYRQMLKHAEKNRNEKQSKHSDPENRNEGSTTIQSGDCRVRILVAYDTQASSNMADPIAFVNSCIDATNTAYNNSGVNFNVELAVSLEETYSEALNSSIDKTRFHDNGDGYLDDVFDYRTYFDADMCILIVENLQAGICGEAYTVANSSYNDPFCVVTRGCAVSNLSFPHELGHLYGCRHDPYVDNTSTPYSYGHGYVYLPGTWRTIMAYNNYCSDNGSSCTRIQYFSNPSISYGGIATGVAGANDNNSALEASRANISSLETTVTDKIFFFPYTFTSGEQSDVVAFNSVTNNSSFIFNSGSSGTWRSGNLIDMQPGFFAQSGSTFRAYSDACNTLRIMPQQTLLQSFDGGTLQVQPNPFIDNVEIEYYNPSEGHVRIQLYDILGIKVRDLLNDNLKLIGPYKFSINANDLTRGVYILELTHGDKKVVKRIIKN